MFQKFHEIQVKTGGQNLYNFTPKIIKWVKSENLNNGFLNINILHTSASLIIQENADPDVMKDMKNFFNKLVPMNENYIHSAEGEDDMPGHIKSTLMNSNLTLSVIKSKLQLGNWQGIFLYEHRLKSRVRFVQAHIIGN